MDTIDRHILALLQNNCAVTNQWIADRVGVSASSALRRIHKLEEMGVIKKRVALVDNAAIGINVAAFIFIKLSTHGNKEDKKALLSKVSESRYVVALHTVAGDIDMVAHLMCESVDSVAAIADDLFSDNAIISQYNTYISLCSHKSDVQVYL